MHAMTDRIKAENLTAWSSYQDFQVPSMEEQMSEVSTPPAFSPISSVDTQALEIYESPTPQQMQYQQSYPRKNKKATYKIKKFYSSSDRVSYDASARSLRSTRIHNPLPSSCFRDATH